MRRDEDAARVPESRMTRSASHGACPVPSSPGPKEIDGALSVLYSPRFLSPEAIPFMDRQHRRDLKHDRFVDEVGSLTTRARENQRFLLTVTVGLVALALIVYGLYFYRSNRERQGQDALAAAIEAIDSPLIQAGNPNPQAKFKTEDERSSRSEAMFRDVQKKYSGTNASDVANLYLARIAASRNDVA